MIKISQNDDLYIKSYTEDNFPYVEVFFDSSKKILKDKLEVRRFYPHPTDKTKKIIHFNQKVKIIYKSFMKSHGNLDEDIPGMHNEIGVQRISSTIFSRVYSCLEEVPASVTLEMIQEKILTNKRACLYSVISNRPVVPMGPKREVKFTEKDLDDQLLKYFEDEEPNRKGDLILDKYGKPQYRQVYLSLTGQPDVDLRSSVKEDYFLPPSFKSNHYGRR